MKTGNFFLNLIISLVRIIYAFWLIMTACLLLASVFLRGEHQLLQGTMDIVKALLSFCLILSALILEKKNKKWLLMPLIPLVFFFLAVLWNTYA